MNEVKGNNNAASVGGSTPTTTPATPNTNTPNTKSTTPTQANASAAPAPGKQPVSPIQFNSTTGSKSSQKIDHFAEQNAKATIENKAKAKKRKKIIIGSSIGGVLAIAGIIALVLVIKNNPPYETSDQNPVIFTKDTIAEDTNKLQNQATEAYNFKATVASNGDIISSSGNLEAADKIFQETLDNPKNKDYKNEINLSRMVFYVNNGYYTQTIQTLSEISPNELTTQQRAAYYNLASMAYCYAGDEENCKNYSDLAQQERMQLNENYGG